MTQPAGRLARPTVLTPGVQAAIVAALARGSYLTTACQQSGITPGTFYYWSRRLRSGDPAALVFAGFFSAVDRASAVAEIEALRQLQAGGPDWLTHAWFLSRRFPQRWLAGRPGRINPIVDKRHVGK